jgi:menaquinone-dependent protoporphyrinogen IX oxidase
MAWGEALVAVVDQRLEHRRWQAVLVALLGGTEGIVEMRTLFWPAGDLVQLVVAVCPGGQNAEHQQ